MAPEPINLNTGKVKPRDAQRPPRGESAPGQGAREAAQDAAPEPRRRSANDKKLADSLARFYTTIGMGCAGIGTATGNMGLAVAGVNITSQSEDTANAWMELADANPKIKRALEGFAVGSAWATVASAHVTMAAPILLAIRNDGEEVNPMADMIYQACLSDDAKKFAMMATAMADTQ